MNEKKEFWSRKNMSNVMKGNAGKMKKIVYFTLLLFSLHVQAEEVCNVKICNRIKRLSLSIWSHVKDSMGEVCFDLVVPKNLAVEGKELTNKSKWYQGSFNPTKRSVTYVKSVVNCNKGI